MEEYKKLLRLLHKDRQYLWELYARLAFCTALRVSDILSLAWADILHKGSLTKIEKKTGKVRKIPFNLSIQTRIEELYILLKRPNPNELIFKSKFTGVSVSSQYLNRIMKEWKAKYKLDIENFLRILLEKHLDDMFMIQAKTSQKHCYY